MTPRLAAVLRAVLSLAVFSTPTLGQGLLDRWLGSPVPAIERLAFPSVAQVVPQQSPRRQRIGDETRSAVPATSTGFELQLPQSAARVLFSTGATGPGGRPMPQFRVRMKRGSGWSTIFEEAAAPDSGKWQDYSVDLESGDGPETVLRFDTTGPVGEARALFWGSIRVIRDRYSRVRPPNVILVSLDTLRADYVSALGGPPGLTPHLDEFLKRSFSFREAFSQYPNTLFSHAALFTGIYPLEVPRNLHRPLSPTLLLTRLLADRGYATAAFTEDAYVGSDFGFDTGFDSFDNGPPRGQLGEVIGDAPTVFSKACRWVESHATEAPFFLFVHTYEVHSPYIPRDEEARRVVERMDPGYSGRFEGGTSGFSSLRYNSRKETLAPAELRHLAALYAGEVNSLDRAFGQLVRCFDSNPSAAETLVVLTSDHGEGFGEHGKLEHGENLHREVLHVPLAFHWPGQVRSGESTDVVQLVDVTPTILDFAGLGISTPRDGRSLAPYLRGEDKNLASRPAFADLGWATGECQRLGLPNSCRVGRTSVLSEGYRLTVSRVPEAEVLFDVNQDPGETRNLASERPDQLARLRRLLDSRFEAPGKRKDTRSAPKAEPDARVNVDAGTRERLRALGYEK